MRGSTLLNGVRPGNVNTAAIVRRYTKAIGIMTRFMTATCFLDLVPRHFGAASSWRERCGGSLILASQALMVRLPIFDGHNNTLLHLHLQKRGGGRSFFVEGKNGHIDLPRAKRGGFAGGSADGLLTHPHGVGLYFCLGGSSLL